MRAAKRQVYTISSTDPVCGSAAAKFHLTWASDIADAMDRVEVNYLQDGELCTSGEDVVGIVNALKELLDYAASTDPREDEKGKRRED